MTEARPLAAVAQLNDAPTSGNQISLVLLISAPGETALALLFPDVWRFESLWKKTMTMEAIRRPNDFQWNATTVSHMVCEWDPPPLMQYNSATL